jgi:hypothetical protein
MLFADFTVFFDDGFCSVLRENEPDRPAADLEAPLFATFFLLLLLRFLAAALFADIAWASKRVQKERAIIHTSRGSGRPRKPRFYADSGGSCTAGDGDQFGRRCSATIVV